MSKRTEALRALLARESQSRRIVLTGHDMPDVDSLISCVLMQRLLLRWDLPCEIALPTQADGQSHRVLAEYGFDPECWRGEIAQDAGVILLDHHRPLHAGQVLACVDHHGTDCPPAYPYTQIEPCGACALMVLRLIEEAGFVPTGGEIVLAVTALYLDTIALRSTKVLPQEMAWAKAQVERLGLDEGWLQSEGMKLEDMTLADSVLALRGRKDYEFAGRRVVSTYVQTDAMTDARLSGILSVIRSERKKAGADLWVFLVHDPVKGKTMEYDVTDGDVEVIDHGHLASRGKDIMPRVERMIRGKQGKAEVSDGADA